MKKLLVFVTLFLVAVPLAWASSFEVRNNIIQDQVADEDLYLVGSNVVINEEVKGDVFALGNMITVNAVVHGDLLVVGSNVIINAKIGDDARVTGGNVSINANIGGDLVVPAAGTINIADSAYIGGDAVINGGLLNFAGEIQKDIKAFLLNVNFKGKAGANVNMFVDRQILIDENASIAGDLQYYALQRATFSRKVVGGAVNFNDSGSGLNIYEQFKSQFSAGRLLFTLASFLGFAIIAFVLITISPKHLIKSVSEMDNGIVRSFLYGFIGAIAFVVLGFVLMLTVVGIPLGLIFIVLTTIFFYLGRIFFALWLGQRFFKLKSNDSRAKVMGVSTLGLLIYYLVGFIPLYIGFTLTLLFSFTGFGAFILSRVTYFKFLKKNKMA